MAGVNRKGHYPWRVVACVFLFFTAVSAFSQGSAFTYQGQLSTSGAAASGNYDLKFTVYNAPTNGTAVSGFVTNFDVPVNNGLFTTTIDFGAGVFTGPNLWLEIGVRTNGGTDFSILSPRQPVLPVPYAIFANSASNLVGVLPASQLSGTLPASAFQGYTNTVALTNGANLFAGAFSGNGAAVTNVEVTHLTGVLAASQLPNDTAYVDSNQTFTANNTFNGSNTFTNLYGNSFSGSFFGNGLVGWIVVTGTTAQAEIDHGYLLTNSQVVTVTLPTLAHVGDIVRVAGSGASGWVLAQNSGQSVLGNFLAYGKSWAQSFQFNANWKSIAASPDGTIVAAAFSGAGGDGGAVSRNSGQTWSQSSPNNSFSWQAVAVSPNDQTIAFAAYDQPIYISTNLGTSWTETDSGSANWTGLASTGSGNNFVALASGYGIYTNSGTTWAGTYSAGGNNWTCISLAAGGSELVAANSGTGIFASMNSGATWTELYSSGNAWDGVACSASGNRIIASVSGGGVYISTNSGASFIEFTNLPTSAAWSGVSSSSDGSKLEAAVNGGYIYTSSNWGITWATNLTTAAWTGVTSSSDGSIAAAGINNNLTSGNYGLFTSQAGSQSLTTAGTAGYISGAQASSVELQYVGNNQFMPVSFYGTIWGN